MISADVLDQALGAWLHTRAVQAGGRLVIAVDGKAVRGAKDKTGKAPHLVAALAHGIGAVLGQVAVDAKSNEIPAVRDLLKAFADLAGAVITIDALHTQHDTAKAILARHAEYVMTVKANMPTLHRQLKKLPWACIPAASSVSTSHGRRARRTIKAVLAPTWIEFAGAAQVAQLRRTVTKKGKKTVEVAYLITSDRDADPATLSAGSAALAEAKVELGLPSWPGVGGQPSSAPAARRLGPVETDVLDVAKTATRKITRVAYLAIKHLRQSAAPSQGLPLRCPTTSPIMGDRCRPP
jgi:predicted transposase YbfD/YdcC